MSSANTLYLKGYNRKQETMHTVLEGDINDITQPTVIFSHTYELEIPELANAETDPPKNLQENGAAPPVNT